MISFNSFLIESANEEKLTHLEHAEDHPINAGSEGFSHAFNTLHDTHEALMGRPTKVKISTKYDGSPSIVFGYHPENKRFFVASKSAFNKNPKLNYTDADIEKNHGHAPGLVAKLKAGLLHLPKVTPHEGVYQGDMMYSKKDGDVESSQGAYHFKPNTITYSAKHDSDEGKKIKNAKIGVVVHTAYHGNNLENMKAEYNADLSNFDNHSDVHIINPTYKPSSAHYTPEAREQFKKHMKNAVAANNTLDDYKHTKGHIDTIKTYINKTVREDEKPSTAGYKSFLEAHHNKEVASVKSDAAKNRKREIGAAAMEHVENNKSLFDNTFKMHHELQKAKDVLVNTLAGSKHAFHHTIGGVLTKPEGFVASINNRPTKLVDRAEFSKANFLARPR